MKDVSPKVTVPAFALAALGFLGLALGFAFDEDALLEVGGALLAASGLVGGVGYNVTDPKREEGYSIVEMAFAVVILLILIVVLFALLDRV